MPFEAFIVAALQYKEPGIQSSYGDFWLLVPDFFFKGSLELVILTSWELN